MRNSILVIALLSFVAACASTDSPDPDVEERDVADTAVEDVAEDVAVDVADDPDVAPDVPDVVEDTADTADVVDEPDAAPDVEEVGRDAAASCDAVGTECEPYSTYCTEVDGHDAVGFCTRCGNELRTEACAEREVCDATLEDGPGCRPCEGAECPISTECPANGRSCLDFNTVQICDADGMVESIVECPTGRRCFDGSCGSAGAWTGEVCEIDIDPDRGCNGHTCLCGEEHIATPAGAAACAATPGVSSGYCTTTNCIYNGCDTGDEACVDFSVSGTFDSGAYCVNRASCTRAGTSCGARSGFECGEMPVREGPGARLTWELACWPPLQPIGAPCDSDLDCVGGECRVAEVGGDDVSYCTMPCGESAGCPSNAECLADPDGSGFVCLALANATACPRITTQTLYISSTGPRANFEGGTDEGCYFAR